MSETHYIHHDPEGDPLHIAPSEDTPGARLLLPQYPAWWDVRREDAPAVCRDILAAAGSTARVVEEIEPTGTDTLTWDWRSQPDLDALAEILARHGVTLRQVDTGSDSYEIAISGGGIPRASDSADTGIDLEAIRQRDSGPLVYSPEGYITLAEDRTALLAEIERLARQRDRYRTAWTSARRRAQCYRASDATWSEMAQQLAADLEAAEQRQTQEPPTVWSPAVAPGGMVCEACGSPEYDHIRRSEDDRLDCPAQPAYRRLAAVERDLASLRQLAEATSGHVWRVEKHLGDLDSRHHSLVRIVNTLTKQPHEESERVGRLEDRMWEAERDIARLTPTQPPPVDATDTPTARAAARATLHQDGDQA